MSGTSSSRLSRLDRGIIRMFVPRAAASKIPLISAVGHETDTTIAELVADERAESGGEEAVVARPRQDDLGQDEERQPLHRHERPGLAFHVGRAAAAHAVESEPHPEQLERQ